jgi:hypothetical protein
VIKGLVLAAALTIGLSGYAVAQEAAHGYHRRHRDHTQPRPFPFLQPQLSAETPDIFWSPAGGNPIHYGQITGFYAGR